MHKSVEAIHRAVALPIDQILNEAVHVIETYIGHDAEMRERLRNILRNARDIKAADPGGGPGHGPGGCRAGVPAAPTAGDSQATRVLVVDADEAVLHDAHTLLERYGCTVETARSGSPGGAHGAQRHRRPLSRHHLPMSACRT